MLAVRQCFVVVLGQRSGGAWVVLQARLLLVSLALQVDCSDNSCSKERVPHSNPGCIPGLLYRAGKYGAAGGPHGQNLYVCSGVVFWPITALHICMCHNVKAAFLSCRRAESWQQLIHQTGGSWRALHTSGSSWRQTSHRCVVGTLHRVHASTRKGCVTAWLGHTRSVVYPLTVYMLAEVVQATTTTNRLLCVCLCCRPRT